MNTTDTRLEEAQRRLDTLRARRATLKPQIDAARAALGAGFAEVADGAEVPLEQQQALAGLVAEDLTLQSMADAARAALEAARAVAFARGIEANAGQMRQLLQVHRDLSHKTDAAVDALAIAAGELRDNAGRILHTFRELRSRNTITKKGVVSIDIAGLVAGGQVQWLIEQGLGYRTLWWKVERRMPFLPAALNATAALTSEFNELMGLDALDPAVLAAARRDMAADGAPLIALPGSEADSDRAEDDVDLSDLSDFNLN